MATKKRAKRETNVPANETKSQRFMRLANKRVVKALNDIRLVGNLGRYDHTAEQTEAIFAAISEAVASAEQQYAQKDAKTKPTFSL